MVSNFLAQIFIPYWYIQASDWQQPIKPLEKMLCE